MLKITPYLDLDTKAKQLVDHLNNTSIILTFSEAKVLELLLSNPDAIFSKEQLLEIGWPSRVVALTSLTQCVSTLRKKLEPYPEIQLQTIARRGYHIHVSDTEQINPLTFSETKPHIPFWRKKITWVISIISLIILSALATTWHYSDYLIAKKHVNRWQADENIDLKLGGAEANLCVFGDEVGKQSSLKQWQQHFTSDVKTIKELDHFSGYAATNGSNYSIAICPEKNGQKECDGKSLINITAIDDKPAQFNMAKFIELTNKMEKRVRYNQVFFPDTGDDNGDITEHNYQADIYYPIENELLVRADLSLSLIYDDADSGQFQSATCVTDQDCLTTPIKYTIRGDFKQYRKKIGKYDVDVFQVAIKQKSLTKPEQVSESAMRFYRAIRKHDIQDNVVYFYRIYNDQKTAVWILPLMGETIAWSHYSLVKL